MSSTLVRCEGSGQPARWRGYSWYCGTCNLQLSYVATTTHEDLVRACEHFWGDETVTDAEMDQCLATTDGTRCERAVHPLTEMHVADFGGTEGFVTWWDAGEQHDLA